MACALGAGFSWTAAAKAGASAIGEPIVVVSGEDAAALMGVGAGGGGACETAMDIAASDAAAGSRVAFPSTATALATGSLAAAAAKAGASAGGAPIVVGSGESIAALTGIGGDGGGACATIDEADFGNGDEIAAETAGAREATVVLAGCAGSRAARRFTAIVTG